MFRAYLFASASCLAISLFVGSADAASHRDWTSVPLGAYPLTVGETVIQMPRPTDRFGVIPSPIALQAIFDPSVLEKGPIQVEVLVGDKKVQNWEIHRLGDIYVIGTAVLDECGGKRARQTPMTFKVASPDDVKLSLVVSGPPDLKLAGNDWVGPLKSCVEQLERGFAKEYLTAVLKTSRSTLARATSDFARLGRSSDPMVARFAREKLRRIAFAECRKNVGDKFGGNYRMGLYAQQCGFFRDAARYFGAASELSSTPLLKSDALYRLGESMERCGYSIDDVALVMEKAGNAAEVEPNTWDVWVTILMREYYEETENGRTVTKSRKMTDEQIETLTRDWERTWRMVYGASGGHLLLRTTYKKIPDNRQIPYVTFGGWLHGPSDALLDQYGSVDTVMAFRSSVASETGGADCGPMGAAMVDIGFGRGWEVFLHEWNHTFDWTRIAGEAGDGYPITHHSDGCGHQPIASMGYGHHASMRYWVTPGMYRRMETADPDTGRGYIKQWWIGKRHSIEDKIPEKDLPSKHVVAFGPAQYGNSARELIESEQNFIDLYAATGGRDNSGDNWYVTPATTYVWSPKRQEVRMWLGHNDGMAMWLNYDLVHRGDYFAQARFGDKNLPNMVAIGVMLRQGWNRIDIAVESWPKPHDRGYGFSVRVCDMANDDVPGLMLLKPKDAWPEIEYPDPKQPAFGYYYKWDEVRDDYYWKLPRISESALAEYMGLSEEQKLTVTSDISATTGFFAIGTAADADGALVGGVPTRTIPKQWNAKKDHDIQLNNVMDYNREAVAVYPFMRLGAQRHLLILRAEAIGAYLTCLQESADAVQVFGGRPPRERILGYFQTGTGEGTRVWIAVETLLTGPLPMDEEDLLTPLPQ